MKQRIFTLIPVLALSLLFAGCSTTTGKSDEDSGDGAPVSEAGQGQGMDGGAETAGAIEGGSWAGSPLDNPDSPLSSRTIFFDYDSSDIREDFRDVVIAHGEYLAAEPQLTITVEGHADERGSREYNISLGERRANTVRSLLMAQGAVESQISTVSYGEEQPLVLGSDEAAWSQNRRAELIY